jgi:methylated-DNA-[protein]-cysteine S-methyltransferase
MDERVSLYESPIGTMLITSSEKGIRKIFIMNRKVDQDSSHIQGLNENWKKQFDAYFSGESDAFTLPLDLIGTPFQIQVWEAALTIPYGETVTYEDVARAIGRPKAVRAVGSALNKNAVCLVVPCHRVVSKTPGGGGYAYGEDKKEFLLAHERAHSKTAVNA